MAPTKKNPKTWIEPIIMEIEDMLYISLSVVYMGIPSAEL